MPKICFIFRDPNKGGKSIEELFLSISRQLEQYKNYQVINYTLNHSTNVIIHIKNLLKLKADIYHITGDINYIAMFLPKKKIVLTIHDIGHYKNLKGIKKYLFRLFWLKFPIQCSAAVTTVSKYTLSDIVKYNIDKNSSKYFVVSNPLSTIFKYQPKVKNNSKPIILQIGTGENKNLSRLVEALEDIECKLLIIGKLNKQQISKLKKHKILFDNKEDLTHKEVYNCYCQSDLVTFLSTHEGFGMPLIEAQGTGRVVISSNICSIPEIANDSALLIDPYNIPEIKKSIIKCLTNPSYCEKLIKQGLYNVERFDINHIIGDYIKIYNKILTLEK